MFANILYLTKFRIFISGIDRTGRSHDVTATGRLTLRFRTS